jgi:hypothetical protein
MPRRRDRARAKWLSRDRCEWPPPNRASSRSTSRLAAARLSVPVNNAKFVIQVSKGLIRQPRARRLLMFYSVLVAVLMLFAGTILQWPDAREHPILFLGYWAACAWITLLAVLLALYDLAKVRGEARRLRSELAEQHLKKTPHDEKPG